MRKFLLYLFFNTKKWILGLEVQSLGYFSSLIFCMRLHGVYCYHSLYFLLIGTLHRISGSLFTRKRSRNLNPFWREDLREPYKQKLKASLVKLADIEAVLFHLSRQLWDFCGFCFGSLIFDHTSFICHSGQPGGNWEKLNSWREKTGFIWDPIWVKNCHLDFSQSEVITF